MEMMEKDLAQALNNELNKATETTTTTTEKTGLVTSENVVPSVVLKVASMNVGDVVNMISTRLIKQSLKDSIAELRENTGNAEIKEYLEAVSEVLKNVNSKVDKTGLNREQVESKKLQVLNTLSIPANVKIAVHSLITGDSNDKKALMLEKSIITKLTLKKITDSDFSLDYTIGKTTLTTEVYYGIPKNISRYTIGEEKEGYHNVKKSITINDIAVANVFDIDQKAHSEILKAIIDFKTIRQENVNFTPLQVQEEIKKQVEKSLEKVEQSKKELEQQLAVYEG